MRCIPFNPQKLPTIKNSPKPQKTMIFCLSHLIAQELQALQSHARCLCVGNASSTVGNKSNIKKIYPKNYHKSKPIKKPSSRLEQTAKKAFLLNFFFNRDEGFFCLFTSEQFSRLEVFPTCFRRLRPTCLKLNLMIILTGPVLWIFRK